MQTYEIAPDESMETLVRSLSRAARKDKDIVLIVPAGVNPFNGAESIAKLNGVLRGYDARVQVQAADPQIVSLFRSAGMNAGPLTAGAPAAGGGAPAPAAAMPGPAAPPPAAAPAGGLPDDIANMNFDFADVGTPAPAARPAPAAPAAPPRGGFLSKLKDRMSQPGAPLPNTAPPPSRPPYTPANPGWPAQPDWANAAPPAAPSEPSADEAMAGLLGLDMSAPAGGGSGLDATMPDWLRDAPAEPAPPAGNRVVGRPPASNLDVTMPSWLSDTAGDPTAGPLDVLTSPDAGLPSWLTAGDPGPAAAPPAAGEMPDWLRRYEPAAAGTPAAAPAAPPAPAAPLPAPAAPPPAPAAMPPSAAPAPARGGFDLSAMAGPQQTAETIGQAVRAANLDARTRALLLFGMALVRLAGGEANAAAMAARQAGCGPEELQLVVEMAQALGGGPSERLGRKILGG